MRVAAALRVGAQIALFSVFGACLSAGLAGCAAPDETDVGAHAEPLDATSLAVKSTHDAAWGLAPIGLELGDKRHVAYSVPLDALAPGQRLVVRAEVAISRCNKDDIQATKNSSECYNKSNLYNYDPNIGIAVYLSDSSKGDGTGKHDQVLVKWKKAPCTSNMHHCARAIWSPAIAVTKKHLKGGAAKFVNVVVSPYSGKRQSGDFVEVEGKSEATGGLHVIQLGEAYPNVAGTLAAHAQTDVKLLPCYEANPTTSGGTTVPAPSAREKRRVVASAYLEGLAAGEALDVTANMLLRRTSATADRQPLVGALVLLTTEPWDPNVAGTQNANSVVPYPGYTGDIAFGNGTNCPDPAPNGCRTLKAGAFQVPPDFAGKSMFAHLIAYATRDGCNDKKHSLKIDKASLAVRRRGP